MSNNENDMVIYFLVRTDLKMSKGKIVAQCCHAVEDLITRCPRPLLLKYKNCNHPKICLRINDLDHMNEIINHCSDLSIQFYKVIDAGLTQVDPNTPTVLGIGPVSKQSTKHFLSSLKLL